MDPYAPLSVARELNDESVKLLPDEVKALGKAAGRTIHEYAIKTEMEMPGVEDVDRMNQIMASILLSLQSTQPLTLNHYEYTLLLDNIDVMIAGLVG